MAVVTLLRFDLDLAAALDGSVADCSIAVGETLGFYIRPAPEYAYDGVASYEVTMADGSPLVPGITLNDPVSFPDFMGDAGDINRDGAVNSVDLGILRANFFTSHSPSDLNNDGAVNPVDLGILKRNFFKRANLFFDYLEWDPGVTGNSVELQVTMHLNGTMSVKKNIELTVTASP